MKNILLLLDKLKETLLKIWNWEKGSVWAWILKGFYAVLIILLIVLFTVKVLPILALILCLLYFFLPDIKHTLGIVDPADSQHQTAQTIQFQLWTSAELIFEVTKQYSAILDIVQPRTLPEIIPTRYPAIQEINGCTAFRFILRPANLATLDKSHFLSDFNIFISHVLRSDFPNIQTPFPFGLPCVYVLRASDDPFYPGFLRLDVILIENSSSANLVSSYINRQIQKAQTSTPASPTDRDF